MRAEQTHVPSSSDAVITYQTLRIGMVAVVTMLAVAVIVEAYRQEWQFESSISAYWYTPVQPVFVGVLVAIGVALIVIKGTTPWEDTFLNFAGISAPVVAFVPTLLPGEANLTDDLVLAQVANSMTALLVVGGFGIAVAGWLRSREQLPAEGRAELWRMRGTIGIYLVGLMLFVFVRGTFTGRAHAIAAVLMFGSLAVVALLAAFKKELRNPAFRPAYTTLSAIMAAGIVVAFVGLVFGTTWFHFILFVETVEILAFIAFWMLQTGEHWREAIGAATKERKHGHGKQKT